MLKPSYIRLSCNTGAYALMARPTTNSRNPHTACGRFQLQPNGTHEQPGLLTDYAVNSGRSSRVMWCGVQNLVRPSVCELHLPRWRHYCLAVRPTHYAGQDDRPRRVALHGALPEMPSGASSPDELQCNWTFVVHRRKEVQLPRLQTLTIVHNGSTARLLVPVQGGSTGRPDWFVKLMLKHYWAVVTGTGCVMMLLLPKGFTGPGPRDSAPRNQAAAAGHLRSRWLLTELLDFALELVVKLSYTMAVTLLFDWALESAYPLGVVVLLLAVWYWLARPGWPIYACARVISVAWYKVWKLDGRQRSARRSGSVAAGRARKRQGPAGR